MDAVDGVELFECGDCGIKKDIKDCYITRFASEKKEGETAASRTAAASNGEPNDGEPNGGEPNGGEPVAKRQRIGAAPQQGDQFSCVDCRRLKARVSRVMNQKSLKEDWLKIPKDTRVEFMQKASSLYGDELAKYLSEVVVQVKATESLTSFEHDGNFMDLADMTDAYKDKPEQLAHVLANTQKFFCPIAKTTMYSKPQYKINMKETESTKETQRREIARRQEAIKPIKAPTPPKEPKVRAHDGASGPKWNASHKNFLEKQKNKLVEPEKSLSEILGKVTEPLREHVPPFAVKKVETALAFIRQCKSEIDLALETETPRPPSPNEERRQRKCR